MQNFPMVAELQTAKAIDYAERPALIAYIGGITDVRGINEMIRAMALVPARLKAQLVLAGSFSPTTLEDLVKNLPGWEYVKYLGWQSRTDVATLLGSTRIGLVVYHGVPGAEEAQPTKLFEYMSAGVPVIASNFRLWREIVEKVGCGVCVNPREPEAIARAITLLLDHPEQAEAMGHRGMEEVKNCFNWNNEAKKLIKFYGTLLTAPGKCHLGLDQTFNREQ